MSNGSVGIGACNCPSNKNTPFVYGTLSGPADNALLREEADYLESLTPVRNSLNQAYTAAAGLQPQEPTLDTNERISNVIRLAGVVASDLNGLNLTQGDANRLRYVAIRVESLAAGGSPMAMAETSTPNGPVSDVVWLRERADYIAKIIQDRTQLSDALNRVEGIQIHGSLNTIDRINAVIFAANEAVGKMSGLDGIPNHLRSTASAIEVAKSVKTIANAVAALKNAAPKTSDSISSSRFTPSSSFPINSSAGPTLPFPVPVPTPVPTPVPSPVTPVEDTSSSSAAVTADVLTPKSEGIGYLGYAIIAGTVFGGAFLLMNQPKSKSKRARK